MTTDQFWKLIKGVIRAFIRTIIEVFHRLLLNIFDTLFGFLNWPQKKLRIKVYILPVENESTLTPPELDTAITYAKTIFRKKFNVDLLPVDRSLSFAGVLKTVAPSEALYTKGGRGAFIEEFKTAGTFFAAHLVAPVYPVTVFVVVDIKGATGCSLGPMTDYVTLDHGAARDTTILAHELAHACGLWHLNDKSNLLWNRKNRGDNIRWWQKNVFRSSRHVTYW